MARTGLDPTTAARFLLRHDLIQVNEIVQARVLGGGVSATVVLVECPTGRFVLKQPRARFATEAEWVVDTGRGRVEYLFGRFLERHLGHTNVVPMVGYDHVDDVIIMDAAPLGWRVWKEHLLAGQVSLRLAKEVGRSLGRVHSLVDELEAAEFRHDDYFHQQRGAPYFAEVARRKPAYAERMHAALRLFHSRNDLVHGDYSPKNLVTDPDQKRLRLIDHEVVTRGDAAFDLAFVVNHLVLKSIHIPRLAEPLHECAAGLVAAYHEARVDDDDPDAERERRTVAYLGPLLMARAIGKSPAEYLDRHEQDLALKLGETLVEKAPETVEGALAVAAQAHDR